MTPFSRLILWAIERYKQRKQEPGDLGMAKYEIPQLLLQANVALNYDENLGQYEAFVISVDDTSYTYTFPRAIIFAE